MKIYNTYSQKLEKVNLKKQIKIYVCGITPYDTTHLGHAFTFIVYDSLIKYLRFNGASLTYVQNVTDIDDDILIRARHNNESWQSLGKTETNKHVKNMDSLNCARPEHYPKATKNISQMIKIIESLVAKKFAYKKNGNVYFDIKKDKNFGKLSKFGYPAMLEIASERGNYPLDPNKKDPLDFILWQAQKPGEPYWDSPLGKGRPGWHIECSAMSMRYLGPTITIHGGGSDLIFPHHEAEIAQSQNYSGKKFVDIWMHAAMVYYEGKKMSKSLGNMVFVSDLLKNYDANTIRFLLLSHHYREPWNFEEKELENAKKIISLFKKATLTKNVSESQNLKSASVFYQYLDNDFQTNIALEKLTSMVESKKAGGKALVTCLKAIGIIL